MILFNIRNIPPNKLQSRSVSYQVFYYFLVFHVDLLFVMCYMLGMKQSTRENLGVVIILIVLMVSIAVLSFIFGWNKECVDMSIVGTLKDCYR